MKNAIRKAGFRAQGRIRIKDGKVLMGVVVPVAFDTLHLDDAAVKAELMRRTEELCGPLIGLAEERKTRARRVG